MTETSFPSDLASMLDVALVMPRPNSLVMDTMTRARSLHSSVFYRQIPTVGTEYPQRPSSSKPSSPTSSRLPEPTAFREFQTNGCEVVTGLGYNQGQQGPNGIIPGGYDTTIVWVKVPGDPLRKQYFRNLTPPPQKKMGMIFGR